MSKLWTPAEVEYLKANYGTVFNGVLAKRMQRTKSAITNKAIQLGIMAATDIRHRKWIRRFEMQDAASARKKVLTAGLDNLEKCKDDYARRILLGITRKGPTGYRGMYDLSYTRKQP